MVTIVEEESTTGYLEIAERDWGKGGIDVFVIYGMNYNDT
jgi:hypothetical protein